MPPERSKLDLTVAAVAIALLLVSCSSFAERSFETDSGSWVVFTQPALLMGGREAQVIGFVEMDRETGCVYLHQPEFEITYPSVWPAGTVVTQNGLRLGDGRAVPEGEWVAGGGGYVDVDTKESGGVGSDEARVLERCPGVNNQYGEVAVFDSSAGDIEIGD